MKNTGKVLLAAAIMMILTLQLKAQSSEASANQAGKQQNSVNTNPGKFVDKDNNGVCDNFESRSGKGKGAGFVDKNGDGICDNRVNAGNKQGNNCRNGQGKGANFVDKNGDGICDNHANAGNKQGNNCRNGQGNQHRHGQGKGCGQGKCCKK